MIGERASGLVMWWVRIYTRHVPGPVANRRLEEVAADLHDQIAHERDLRTSEPRIALAVLSRMVRGLAADVSWRSQFEPMKGDLLKLFVLGVVVALGLALLALALDSAIVVLISVGVLALDGLGVFLLGLRSARDGDFVVPYFAILAGALAVAAIGCAAIVWGSADDAPGLVLLGGMLIVSVVVGSLALGIRTAQRLG